MDLTITFTIEEEQTLYFFIATKGLVTDGVLTNAYANAYIDNVSLKLTNGKFVDTSFEEAFYNPNISEFYTIDNTVAHSGEKSLKFVRSGASSGSYKGSGSLCAITGLKATLEKDREYVMHFWYKVEEITSTDGNVIAFTPATGSTSSTRLLRTETKTSKQPPIMNCTTTNSEWQEAEITFYTKKAYNDDELDNLDLMISIGGSGTVYIDDITVYKKDKISFVTNCDTTLFDSFGLRGEQLALPSLEKDSYVFTGWYHDAECLTPVSANEVYNGDYTLYAGWDKENVSTDYTFDFSNTVIKDNTNSFYAYGIDKIPYQCDSTNNKFTVINGDSSYLNISNSSADTSIGAIVLHDKNGILRLNENSYVLSYKYKIEYSGNDVGEFAFAKAIGYNNGMLTQPIESIKITGSTDGWITEEITFSGAKHQVVDGKNYYPYIGISYQLPSGAIVSIDDISLRQVYSVTVNTGLGKFENGETVRIYNNLNSNEFNIENIEVPSKENYKFVGWYSQKGYNNTITETFDITEDIVLFADYVPTGLTVDPNGDGLFDARDLVRAKKASVSLYNYKEWEISRTLIADGSSASLVIIRKMLLDVPVSDDDIIIDSRIAGIPVSNFVFGQMPDTKNIILQDGLTSFVSQLSEFGVSERTSDDQPSINVELLISDNPTNNYTFTVQNNNLTISADSAEALVGALNRFVHMLDNASTNNYKLRMANGFSETIAFIPLDDEYGVTFSDEFNTFDRSIWSYSGSVYMEDSKYLDANGQEVNCKYIHTGAYDASVNDGVLSLSSKKNLSTNSGVVFNGTLIDTENTMNFKYGYIEVRERVGSHPSATAIWFRGMKSQITGNAAEIDLIENHYKRDDNDSIMATNIHTWGQDGEYHKSLQNDTNDCPDNRVYESNEALSLDYHIYALRWTPNEYSFYLDGELLYTYSITDSSLCAEEQDTFRQAVSLVLSIGAGEASYGPYWQEGDADSFTADIDYIRISQRGIDGGSMNINRRSTASIENEDKTYDTQLTQFGLK